MALDAGGFERELAACLDRLAFAARRLAGNAHDAEDLVAGALAEAWAARDRFTPGTNFGGWVYRILWRNFLDRGRRAGREPVLMDPQTAQIMAARAEADTPPEDWTAACARLRQAFSDDIARALDDLPPHYRMAVLLADVYDLPYAQIAEILGVPISTIRFGLHAARARIRARLAGRSPG